MQAIANTDGSSEACPVCRLPWPEEPHCQICGVHHHDSENCIIDDPCPARKAGKEDLE